MACRLPGADGIQAFWQLISQGGTAWGPLPESRLPRDLYFDPHKSRVGKSYSEMGAVVSDRPVDPAACPLTPDLVERFDVAHHIFLEVASQACRDAGMDPFAMPGDRRTGVYVGHTGGSTRIGDIVYANGIDETAALLSEVESAQAILGMATADVAAQVTADVRSRYPARKPGRRLDLGAIGAAKIVQEALRLDGPYLVVDAACASSLQAMAIAARSLLQGGIDQAIVGGASFCKSDSLVLFSAAQSVSNTGSCPFGANADGLITAEGYVAIVIKTLSRALADGDRIRAVIRGLGVASDGKGKSLWAPRQEGQVLAVERAYPDPADIGRLEYIEAHATSTQVGDATELGALAGLMSKHLPRGRKIPIGSVKANIGHTLETAGIASLVKVVLAMEHDLIPPGSTCTEFNEEFDWQAGPFTVPLQPVAWPRHTDGSPRCAAVNAFGIGGLNVHVSLAEHVPGRVPAPRQTATSAGRSGTDADAIAIVGAGCVLPGALSLDEFFARLEGGECAIGPVPADRWAASRAVDPTRPRAWHATAGLGGFVRGFCYDWRRHKVPPKQIDAANPLQFMLLEAADAAIADAGGAQAGLDRSRTGVVVGTLFGGDFADQLQMGLRRPETGRCLRAALAARGVSAADTDTIVAAFDKKVLERMPALIDETGSFTSSTLASRLTKTFDLMGGALALDSGACSSVSALASAVDMLRERACDAVICAAGERSMDLMAYEGRSLAGALSDRPTSVLDGRSQGGHVPGEGAVVLVLKRLTDARAAGNQIRGVIRSVAVGSGRTATDATRRVVREACEQAAVRPDAVRAVEVAVAAGDSLSDEHLAVLGAHYAKSGAGDAAPVAGSLDGLIGHTGAVAGAAAILKLVRGLAKGSLPGTAALEESRKNVHGLTAAASALPIAGSDDTAWRAGCVTVAQDCQAGHVVLDNGLTVPASTRIGHKERATPTLPTAAQRSTPAGRPLVAAIFPGQGSQYTDMFRSLCADSAEARRVADRLDTLARGGGRETLAEIAWQPANGLGTRIWDTQWAMYLGDLFAWGVLRELGFAPDVVASHSFGEFPALAAVGAWTPEDGARATQARAEAVESHGPRHGAMLSVIADRAAVAAALEPFAGQVWVCAENAPQQFVVGGTARVVDALEVVIESRRLKSKRLAVPSPFHTPLLAAAAEHLSVSLRGLPMSAPVLPIYSSTTVEVLDGAKAIRGSLIRQMTETVRWISVVEKLYEAGVRTFVEVGPSGVLVGLARRILEGRSDVTFLQFDQRGRPAGEHLARLRDQLAAAGALRPAAAATPATVPLPNSMTPGRIASFDATARRRERNRSGGGTGRVPAWSAAVNASSDRHRDGDGDDRREPDAAAFTAAPAHRDVTPSRSVGGGITAQVVEAIASARPSARAAAKSRTTVQIVETTYLEDAVAELLAESQVELPLSSAGEASSGARRFLDSVAHLFESPNAEQAAIVAATTLASLCDVLARAGGKAAWLPRRPSRISAGGVAMHTELETFLVDFVVEQTGYPREIVELDADLEADLGIDSIRKAQLFGEIGQKYGLAADESMSLDSFPTLRHLLEYMVPRVGGTAGTRAPEPAPASNGHNTNGHVKNGHATNGHAATQPASAGGGGVAVHTELETFLVDFVVEQTGYPREIVELDADLEADLGIDSIRKAQLFGEIGQKYGLAADESMSLDSFPTLRHLLEYMVPRVGGTAGTRAPESAPASNGHVTNGHASNGHASNGHASNGHASNGHASNGHASNGPPVGEFFERGVRIGRSQAEVIRTWARQWVATKAQALAAPVPIADDKLDQELQGVAAGAGLDPAILRAAFADPAVALGGCDVLLQAPRAAGAVRGLLVCFGRHAHPGVTRCEVAGIAGTIVGVKGLPGGICGWNDSGLMVLAGHDAGVRDWSAQIACERIISGCRSIDDAAALIARQGRTPRGLVVADVRGGVFVVGPKGGLESAGESFRLCEPGAPLARVALADGETASADAMASVVRGGEHALPAALSASSAWLAVGVADGTVAARSGCPRGDWLGADVAAARGAWPAAAEQGRVPSETVPPVDTVTRRYALAVSEIGVTHPARSLRGERVLILGAGGIADALARTVAVRGGIPTVAGVSSTAEAVAAVERAEQAGAVRHFVVVGPRQSGDWLPTREMHVTAPFFASQRWLTYRGRAHDIAMATLTAVTDMGGDFGVSAAVGAVESGALAGLCKGIAREFPSLHVRVVDTAAAVAAGRVADAVVAEMEDGAGPVEIGFVEGRRVTVVPCERPPHAAPPLDALARGSVWVVTGGARGVTAACALELGRRHGLTLVLLGSTRPVEVAPEWLRLDDAGMRDLKGRLMLEARGRGSDPRAAWRGIEKSMEISRSLSAFRAAGVDARYEACDLGDAAAVRATMERITRDLGPVRGIVHGAGFEAACRFEKKTAEGLESTLSPKCIGLEHLLAAVDPGSLQAVVGFGSTSGRLGGHGQADYSLANDMLAKMLGRLRRQRPGLRATVFHWHAWDEVGMASRPESRFVLEQFGLTFMPLAEGVRRFMDEIEAGLPDAEVLVTEPAMCPDAVAGTTAAVPQHPTGAGSLVSRVERRQDGTWVSFRLDPTDDRFLIEHTQHGRPLLPAVMGAELLAQAAIAAGACKQVAEIREFSVERPIGFRDDEPREVRVEVAAVSAGACQVRGWSTLATDEEWVHLQGVVSSTTPDPFTAQLDEPPFPYNPMVYQDDAPLRHGLAFRTLAGLFLDRSGGWARLTAPDPDVVAQPRGAAGWTVPVALLDGCIVACAVYSYVLCGRRVEIPVRFERLRLATTPTSGEKCTARLFFRSQDARESVYDFVLFGSDDRTLLSLDGLHLAVMAAERRSTT